MDMREVVLEWFKANYELDYPQYHNNRLEEVAYYTSQDIRISVQHVGIEMYHDRVELYCNDPDINRLMERVIVYSDPNLYSGIRSALGELAAAQKRAEDKYRGV